MVRFSCFLRPRHSPRSPLFAGLPPHDAVPLLLTGFSSGANCREESASRTTFSERTTSPCFLQGYLTPLIPMMGVTMTFASWSLLLMRPHRFRLFTTVCQQSSKMTTSQNGFRRINLKLFPSFALIRSDISVRGRLIQALQGKLKFHPVSPRVNNIRNDGPELLLEVAVEDIGDTNVLRKVAALERASKGL